MKFVKVDEKNDQKMTKGKFIFHYPILKVLASFCVMLCF